MKHTEKQERVAKTHASKQTRKYNVRGKKQLQELPNVLQRNKCIQRFLFALFWLQCFFKKSKKLQKICKYTYGAIWLASGI